MAKQFFEVPATNIQPPVNGGATQNPPYVFPPQVVQLPPGAGQNFQAVNGGFFPPGLPSYGFWPPPPAAFPQQSEASTASAETSENDTRNQNKRKTKDSSPKRPSSRSSAKKAGDILTQFMTNMRKHICGLNGAELREIILSLCLNSSTVYKHVVSFVKHKEAEEKAVVEHGDEGLGIHLQYFRIGELEALLNRICEHESSTTRDTVKHLILAIEERKELERSKLF
ncbi:hypothetical protein F5Y06DRAFT_293601 [Hypoxylon sp. FL0890]|nr:hypothetical protein F5Y06DRAFT_293601 [Hypoxylon sp. FL0890]